MKLFFGVHEYKDDAQKTLACSRLSVLLFLHPLLDTKSLAFFWCALPRSLSLDLMEASVIFEG